MKAINRLLAPPFNCYWNSTLISADDRFGREKPPKK